MGCFPFPCTVPGFLLVFLCFHFFFFVTFASPRPSNHNISVLLTFFLFFAEPCFSLVNHSFFSFSIVVTEQWLAQKPPRISLPPPVHSLPQVHHHCPRRARPPSTAAHPQAAPPQRDYVRVYQWAPLHLLAETSTQLPNDHLANLLSSDTDEPTCACLLYTSDAADE